MQEQKGLEPGQLHHLLPDTSDYTWGAGYAGTTDTSLSCWPGSHRVLFNRGDDRITSTPREDGSQGEGIRNEPKCSQTHLGLS